MTSKKTDKPDSGAQRRRRTNVPPLLLILVGGAAFLLHDQTPHPGRDPFAGHPSTTHTLTDEVRSAFHLLEDRIQHLKRSQAIASFARQYRIGNRLASDVYAAAENAGIDPDLAFRLVKLESNFNPTVVSPAGAIGLTQLMLSTAQDLDEGIEEDHLFDVRTNLRLGLTYLRMMLEEHEGDMVLALAAYNRGPGAIRALLAQGRQPDNPYERVILRGYKGKGLLE